MSQRFVGPTTQHPTLPEEPFILAPALGISESSSLPTSPVGAHRNQGRVATLRNRFFARRGVSPECVEGPPSNRRGALVGSQVSFVAAAPDRFKAGGTKATGPKVPDTPVESFCSLISQRSTTTSSGAGTDQQEVFLDTPCSASRHLNLPLHHSGIWKFLGPIPIATGK